jgi:hypothetical protein
MAKTTGGSMTATVVIAGTWIFATPWHVSVAAESITAALFAQSGYDVSVQYGANQPEYDLMVAKGERLLKISVKGSQDGGWGLSQSFMKKGSRDYHGAIKSWVGRHKPRTVLCFVQFKGAKLTELPRLYLATPVEVGDRLRASRKGEGETILWERHEWGKRAHGAGTIDEIPLLWKFSHQRIESLLNTA